MQLRRNILSGYVGQIYVTLISIIMVPMYLEYMGAEAYGLVGFFVMLQAWFQLLDVGLTPTMSREASRYRGGAIDDQTLCGLLRILEGIFVLVAILGAIAIITGAESIASNWLKVEQLPQAEVRHAIMLMAVAISFRWLSSLYRGVISGFEYLVWLNGFNIAIATARFVFVIPLFIYVGASPSDFFSYQLMIAALELAALLVKTYGMLPKRKEKIPWSVQWQSLRGVLKFSLGVALTGTVWVLVTQTDKLVLSSLLPLSDYAYFTLAVLVSGGVLVISAPISAALMPRMARLSAEGDEAGLVRIYRNATQLAGIIAIPVSLVLSCFSEQVLWVWTGDAVVASSAAPVLALYALGNGLLVLAAFPYYLQFAKGDLRLHLIGSTLFVAIFIPLLIWATNAYGMVGAGYAWIAANLLPFIIWLPIVHGRFVKGLHAKWLLTDVLSVILLPTVCALVLGYLIEWPPSRVMAAFELAAIGAMLCAASAVSSSWFRESVLGKKWRLN